MSNYQFQEEPKEKTNQKHRSSQETQSKKIVDEQYSCLQEKNKNNINITSSFEVATDGKGSVIINNLNSLVAEQVTDLVNISLLQNVKSKIDNLKTKLYIPSISLSIITGILTFIVAFPKTISDNPLLNRYDKDINVDFFICLWLLLLVITIIFCGISFFSQRKMRRKLSKLTLELEQNNLFDNFIHSLSRNHFSKDELRKYIDGR